MAVARPRNEFGTLPYIAISLVFSIAAVVQSVRQGQLAEPITYDDIGYFLDGGRRLQTLYDLGAIGLLKGYVANPPHAPFASFIPFSAFLLFGFHDWAPALLNTGWVVLLVLAIRHMLTGLPDWAIVSVIVAVLAWPVSGFLVIESRPDVANGLLLAFGCVALLEKPWIGSSARRLAGVSILFALALLTKPTVFPVTIMLYVLSLSLASGIDYLESGKILTLRSMIVHNAKTMSFTLLLVLPYYGLATRDVIDYIMVSTFTSQKQLWSVSITLVDHLTYYLWGRASGWQTMGVWLPIAAAALILSALVAIAVRRQIAAMRVVALGVVFAVSYAAVTITGHKSLFLGIQVTWFCLVFFVVACRFLFSTFLSSMPRSPAAALLGIALVLTAAMTFQWHWYNRAGSPQIETIETLHARHQLIDEILSAVDPKASPPSRLYLPTIRKYLDADVLNYELLKRGAPSDVVFDSRLSSDLEEHLRNMAAATHVLVFSADDSDDMAWLPSFRSLPAVNNAVKSDAAFRRVAVFGSPASGNPIELYERISPFSGMRTDRGFLPEEGPYPQWNLPRVRWAVGDFARIASTLRASGPAVLKIRARSPFEGQEVAVFSNDREMGKCRLPDPKNIVDCTVDLSSINLDDEVELRFSHSGQSADGYRSVLFLGLSVLPRR